MGSKFTSLIKGPLKALHRLNAVTLTYLTMTFLGSVTFRDSEKVSHRMRDDSHGATVNVLKEDEIVGLRQNGTVFTDPEGNSYTVQNWETSVSDPYVHFNCNVRHKLPVIADPLILLDGARL